jgi:SAM-dependent methyltransferase
MHNCRFCNQPLIEVFADLGASPLANSYLSSEQMVRMEPYYPLCTYVCTSCFLVQLPEFETAQAIFSDYAYFSSFSDSWLQHAKEYVAMMVDRFDLDKSCQIIEVASNDGYLLQYFKERGIPVLGIEPAKNIAEAALSAQIPTLTQFFGQTTGRQMAAEGNMADLLIGNNVLAHVPDVNDFVAGMKLVLKPNGLFTMEFPHLLRLMDENQFDTIYHEHFSYYSFITVNAIFKKHSLEIFDVEQIPTHGGSLRIFGCHAGQEDFKKTERTTELLAEEKVRGLESVETYHMFNDQVKKTKRAILKFMIEVAEQGRSIVGYGAPAKGNTLLNFCGIGTDMLPYTVDRSPHKQNHYLPGTRIPIFAPEKIIEDKPDFVLILPWNIKEEIMAQMEQVRSWGGHFVTFIPEVQSH